MLSAQLGSKLAGSAGKVKTQSNDEISRWWIPVILKIKHFSSKNFSKILHYFVHDFLQLLSPWRNERKQIKNFSSRFLGQVPIQKWSHPKSKRSLKFYYCYLYKCSPDSIFFLHLRTTLVLVLIIPCCTLHEYLCGN